MERLSFIRGFFVQMTNHLKEDGLTETYEEQNICDFCGLLQMFSHEFSKRLQGMRELLIQLQMFSVIIHKIF